MRNGSDRRDACPTNQLSPARSDEFRYIAAVMSSFTCQHLNVADDQCLLLKTDCVPGRKGCVLAGQSTFLVPAEERIRRLAEEKRQPLPRKTA